MSLAECIREEEVIDAVVAGRWPDAAVELREHARGCRVCADLALVAASLLDVRDQTWDEARVPSSAIVWWRCRMRARRDAAREAARPVTVAQAIAILSGLVVVIAAAWLALPGVEGLFSRVSDLLAMDLGRFARPDLDLGRQWWVGLFLLVPWLILAPMALYFALSD